ncbi:MAG TPA: cell envelope integrity protein CreD [Flavipsychrobacter sp.]|nr:cell envelope integrity protein CreD [Flavipsychrobacter sp.]
MENVPQSSIPGFMERNRNIIKGFLIGFLILIMMIPTALIHELINERTHRQQEVIQEISSKWATEQTIVGPVLQIPFKEFVQDKDGKVLEYRKHIYLLPEQLQANADITPEKRNRSLYSVMLYRSTATLTGKFNYTALQKLKIDPQNILWDDSRLMLGINDARGLEEEVSLKWNDQSYILEAGLPENNVIENGLNTPVRIDTTKPQIFSLQVKLKGSELLYFTPVGKTTEITATSSWKDPAFDGQYLPVNSQISERGFTAKWKVLQVSRSYPQTWTDAKYDLKNSAFGVRLIQPTDGYAKTERSVKYAILFIALTFVVFFFIETFQKQQIHPLQYILVGLALCIFYTLLLSVSEYTSFNTAYIVAATATIMLIGLYVWSIFKQSKIALGFTTALAGLYTYIFILIQLQDYALLFGSVGLFIILAVLMYFSRKIDWYNAERKS